MTGNVPFATRSLKRLIASIDSGVSVNSIDVPADEDQLGVLKTSCVYAGYFDCSENKTVVAEDVGRVACPVKADTLVVSRMNTPELVGAAGLATSDKPNIYLPDRLWQVGLNKKLVAPRFIYWWAQSCVYRDQVKVACAGASSSMQNLDQESFRAFNVPCPRVAQQERIANFLDEQTARIDALIEEKERLLSASWEYFDAKLGTAVVEGVPGRGLLTNQAAKGYAAVRSDWALVPLKYLASATGGMTPSKEGYPESTVEKCLQGAPIL